MLTTTQVLLYAAALAVVWVTMTLSERFFNIDLE